MLNHVKFKLLTKSIIVTYYPTMAELWNHQLAIQLCIGTRIQVKLYRGTGISKSAMWDLLVGIIERLVLRRVLENDRASFKDLNFVPLLGTSW